MGTYSPAPVLTDAIARQAMDEIMWRTAHAMVAEGAPYKGTLFAGLMINNGKVCATGFILWQLSGLPTHLA
jgi:phosphoribosylamine--glycine ligase